MMPRKHTIRACVAVAALAIATVATVTGPAAYGRPPIVAPLAARGQNGLAPAATTSTTGQRPNIVFVLTDDLSNNLVQYMPHVQALMNTGMTFTNYSVTNSLCCPSRASIFTGEFPHNTDVQSNMPPLGGYAGFVNHADQTHTFAVDLQNAGYRTGFYGKYLNGYEPTQEPLNPPGWTDWGGVDGNGYSGFNYDMSVNGDIVHHGVGPKNYMTTVLDRMGQSFIRRASGAGQPFALEVASFAPHHPYVPAPADRGSFKGLQEPRTPAFNTKPTNAPQWLADRDPLSDDQIAHGDGAFTRRVECVQAVDRMIAHLEATLRAVDQLDNTVFVFSSDNGFHIGEHGLSAGKLTAFDTDLNVPLVVAGPGIQPGSVNDLPVENIDLAPTFDDLAGLPIRDNIDGHSIVPLLHGEQVPWRTLADVEHAYTASVRGDPDIQPPSAGRLPPYRGLRSATFTYVEYAGGDREYYNRVDDPYELHNIYDTLAPDYAAKLHDELLALTSCVGYQQCWADGLPTG